MNRGIGGVTWVKSVEIARVLGHDDKHLGARLAHDGTIRCIRVPGMRPRYALEDVQKYITEALLIPTTERNHDPD